MPGLTGTELRRLFGLLNDELGKADTEGELFLVGGAVMCLAFAARASTQDVDGLFRPARQVRDAGCVDLRIVTPAFPTGIGIKRDHDVVRRAQEQGVVDFQRCRFKGHVRE